MRRRRTSHNSSEGYLFLSTVSFILRFVLCYFTIETVPIFESDLIGIIFGQIISIYVVLRIVAYWMVGALFNYRKGDSPELGVLMYGVVHVALVLVTWAVLALLTLFGVLPL